MFCLRSDFEFVPFKGEDMKDSYSARHVPRRHRPRTPTTPSPVKLTPDEMTDQLQTKLSAMEKLQYALTTHELQVAQRMTEQEKIAAGQVRVTVRSSSSDTSPDSNEPGTNAMISYVIELDPLVLMVHTH